MNKLITGVLFLTILLISSTSVNAIIDYDTDVIAFVPLFDIGLTENGLKDPLSNTVYTNYAATYTNTDHYLFDSSKNGKIYASPNVDGVASISAWINQATSSTSYTIVDQRVAGGTGAGWYFQVDASTDELHILDDIGAGSQHCYSSGVTITNGVWTHVAFTINAGTPQFYVNGQSTSMGSCAITDDIQLTDNEIESTLMIGNDHYQVNGFIGGISDVKLFSETYTDTEILAIYNEGRNYNPYTTSSEPTNTDFNFDIYDEWNKNLILNGSATVSDIGTSSEQTLNLAFQESEIITKEFSTYSITYDGSTYNLNADCIDEGEIKFEASADQLFCYKESNSLRSIFYPYTYGEDFILSGSGDLYLETTTGSYTAAIPSTYTNPLSITINQDGHFSKTFSNLDLTSDNNKDYYVHASEISFDVFSKVTQTQLSAVYNIENMINTTFHLDEGEKTVLITPTNTDYKNFEYNFTVTPLQSETLNVYGAYDNTLTIKVLDAITNQEIEVESNITISTGEFEEVLTMNDGSINAYLEQGFEYLVNVEALNYANNNATININNETQTLSIKLYAKNSVWVYAFDSDTSATLTSFDAEIYNENFTLTKNDTSGVVRFENITSGLYTVKITRAGYTSEEYSLTMTGGSFQTLNTYLTTDTASTVDFTVTDKISGAYLEGVDVGQYRTINGDWTLVSSKKTDLTGRTRFTYVTGVEYRFTYGFSGYNNKVLLLEPLFTSYTVRLERLVVETPNIKGYFITINPTMFIDEQVNNLSFIISSAAGTLEEYTVNITAPNVSISQTFYNANGGQHDFNLGISEGTISDRLELTYTVKETGKSEKTFTNYYYIENVENVEGFFEWNNTNSSMGGLEKSVIATLIILIVVGVVSFASGLAGVNPLIPAAMSFIVFLGLFAVIGFVPMWSLYISGISLLLIVIFTARST